jgi:hypothetical protein
MDAIARLVMKMRVPVATVALMLGCQAWGQVEEDAPAGPAGAVSTKPAFHAIKAVEEGFLYEKAPFPSCHASTIVETDKGTLIAAFFGGTAERNPDVCIWVTRKEKGQKEWGPLMQVADGVQRPGEAGVAAGTGTAGTQPSRLPTWNPVLFQPKVLAVGGGVNGTYGPVQLYYKVGPAPALWWGMEVISEDDGKTWGRPKRLPDGILGPIKDKPIQLGDGTMLSPSSVEGNGGWRVHVEWSTDNGMSWRRGEDLPNDKFKAIQPTLLVHKDAGEGGEKIQMLCRSQQDVLVESWSSDGGMHWTPLAATRMPNPNSGVDAVTLADGRFVLVYNPTVRSDPVKGRTPLNIAVSKDGEHWMDVLTLDNALDGQFSYPAVIQSREGLVHITYTWKRKNIKYVVLDPRSVP